MSVGQPYFVYILWSEPGRCFYIGVTQNVGVRLAQHNTGVSRWTKRHAGSWRLVWERSFPTLGQARCFENLLKAQKGGDGFFEMTGLRRFGRESGS